MKIQSLGKTNIILLIIGVLLANACNPKKQESEEQESEKRDRSISTTPNAEYDTPDLAAKRFEIDLLSLEGWDLVHGFSPDKDEFYLTSSATSPLGPSVIVFRKEGSVWKKHDFYAMYSNRDTLFWKNKYISRTHSGWSTMKGLGSMFERDDWGIMRLTASTKGTYVFDDYKSNDVIRISKLKDGRREEPELLGNHINTGKWTAHPIIAPDESYLIWDSERPDGYGDSDIYVSFRQEDGTWGSAINLGDKVNTAVADFSSRVSADGKYLIFWRSELVVNEDGSTSYGESHRCWVSMQVIEDLRPKT